MSATPENIQAIMVGDGVDGVRRHYAFSIVPQFELDQMAQEQQQPRSHATTAPSADGIGLEVLSPRQWLRQPFQTLLGLNHNISSSPLSPLLQPHSHAMHQAQLPPTSSTDTPMHMVAYFYGRRGGPSSLLISGEIQHQHITTAEYLLLSVDSHTYAMRERQVASFVNTVISTGAEFVRFTIHTRAAAAAAAAGGDGSDASSSPHQLLNTPIISLSALSALEDRHGLVHIDCGEQVRVIIPMLTHPFWQRHRNRFSSTQQPREASSNPADETAGVFLLHRVVFCMTWLLVLGTVMYPYAMIIFLAWKQVVVMQQQQQQQQGFHCVYSSGILFMACVGTVILTRRRIIAKLRIQ